VDCQRVGLEQHTGQCAYCPSFVCRDIRIKDGTGSRSSGNALGARACTNHFTRAPHQARQARLTKNHRDRLRLGRPMERRFRRLTPQPQVVAPTHHAAGTSITAQCRCTQASTTNTRNPPTSCKGFSMTALKAYNFRQ